MATSGTTTHFNTGPDTKTGKVQPFGGQRYRKLKKECLQKKCLFEDPSFKASPQSLGDYIRNPEIKEYPKLSWKRPKEICKDGVPHFIKNGMDLFDVKQQQLGNCWFIAAAASLTLHEELISRVVPQDQSFDEGDYAGIFHFKFWHFGEWVDVVVDDRLPVLNGQLHFAGFTKENDGKDFWMPLLEKAYAKLNGSYAAIIGGYISESLVDLTGGIAKSIYLEIENLNFFETIEMAMKTNSLLGAVTKDLEMDNGLRGRHAYSIIDIKKFNHDDKEVRLLRLRNPWAHTEWKGRWSDKSKMWSELQQKQPELQKQLNVLKNEGEFWIGLADFKQNFKRVDICYLSINAFKKGVRMLWETTYVDGNWTRGTNAGGSMTEGNNTFWNNPKIFVSLWKPVAGRQKSTCIVSLMQKNWRTGNRLKLYFYIFQVPKGVTKENLKQLTATKKSILLSKHLVAKASGKFRDITKNFNLDPGNYLIIPCTKSRGDEGNFILRIFTDTKHQYFYI